MLKKYHVLERIQKPVRKRRILIVLIECSEVEERGIVKFVLSILKFEKKSWSVSIATLQDTLVIVKYWKSSLWLHKIERAPFNYT